MAENDGENSLKARIRVFLFACEIHADNGQLCGPRQQQDQLVDAEDAARMQTERGSLWLDGSGPQAELHSALQP